MSIALHITGLDGISDACQATSERLHNILSRVNQCGKQIADGALTLKQLNDKTTKTVDTRAVEGLKIKGSMKVGDAEKLFDTHFGVTVQIKKDGKLVPNEITIGQAARGEF